MGLSSTIGMSNFSTMPVVSHIGDSKGADRNDVISFAPGVILGMATGLCSHRDDEYIVIRETHAPANLVFGDDDGNLAQWRSVKSLGQGLTIVYMKLGFMELRVDLNGTENM